MAATIPWRKSLQIIVLPLVLIASPNNATYLCQNLKLQNCSRHDCTPTTFSFECPKIQNQWHSLMKISVKINEEAKLECSSKDVNYEWLEGISIGYVNFLDIKFCPMPVIHFYNLLSKLNITGVKKIRISQSFRNFTLESKYFQNIDNITHLLMPSNHLSELPADFFQNMTDLTNLDLQGNNLTLRRQELSSLKSLKILELGNNNIQQILPGTFQNLRKLEFLNIWGNNLKSLTKEMFDGLENLTSLDVSTNQISSISADAFLPLKNLKKLSLLKNNFTFLPENLFSLTKKLEIVKLQFNDRLRDIPRRLFADLSLLQEILLTRCNISIVPEDIFWGTIGLVKVDLSANSLVTLPKLLFRDTDNLKELYLSNNKIAFLEGFTFSSLKNLQILQVQKNKLSSINEEMFQGLRELKTLNLNNNSIENVHSDAFKSMTNLQHLVMSHNKITFEMFIPYDSSPISHCRNLEVLDLSHNGIHTMFSDWMWILTKLRILDLSYNNFTFLDAHSFQFFSSHIQVNLQYNKIRTLDLQFFELMNLHNAAAETVKSVSVVNLTGNELECNCKIYDLLRYRERKMQPTIYEKIKLLIDELTCKSPSALSRQPIRKLNSQTYTCEWHFSHKCPTQCQCSEWLAANHLIINCTGANLTRVPEDLLNPHFANKLLLDLILDNNYLRNLPLKSSLQHINVTTLSVSHNYISWIDDDVLPSTIKELKLDHNNLTHINSSLLEFLTNKTSLTLYNNPWRCDCESLDFLGFLQNSFKQVEKLDNITCSDGRPLALLIAEEICPLDRTTTIIASTTIAVVGILIGVLAAIYFRYQVQVKVWLYAHNMCLWFVTEDELDKDKIYDAFISYSHQDEEFVTSKLLPELENGIPPFKICVHYRDWIVGEFITTQITRSVDDSKRTIVILSKNFIKSEWGRLEFRAAHKQALTEKRARVIVVLYGDLGPLDNLDSELRSYLSTNTYVKWGDPWFWDKLRYALPHRRKSLQNNMRGTDKLELINSSAAIKSSTPPADVTINPLEVINNFSNKQRKILNEFNGYVNNGYNDKSCEISVT